MSLDAANSTCFPPAATPAVDSARAAGCQQQRAKQYPLSRWYLQPLAGWLAAALATSFIRPAHLTFSGLLAAAGAATVLLAWPQGSPLAAVLVLVYWLFDRADGQLARRQHAASPWGSWLDANVDELVDLGLHAAVAASLAQQQSAAWPWWLLAAMCTGKYLLMYGLAAEEHQLERRSAALADRLATKAPAPSTPLLSGAAAKLRYLYHLPGNADVRTHLLVVALAGGWLTAELALVAAYYHLRWIARYVLVFRRLRQTG